MPLGLRQAELSRTARYLLDSWSTCAAQVQLMDAWVEERGWLDEDGRPPGFTPAYFAARNQMVRLFTRLEPHLLEASDRKAGRGSMVRELQRANEARRP